MEELGYSQTLGNLAVIKADIDEKAIRRPEPSELVRELGHAKADAILAKIDAFSDEQRRALMPEGAHVLLLTGDQVVVHKGQILEKPESADEIRANCKGFAEAPASTVGSVVITPVSGRRRDCFDRSKRYDGVDITEIYFRPIPEQNIERLITEGDVFYCAGGLMIEHPLVLPYVDHLLGTQDAVMGLSKALVTQLVDAALKSRA
ncbi:Maf-like protein [Porphyridium purpureum]|uniref:Maf-like protein n=1 Tax=Porphyridium purpureum TaxID=35688 RepID=A0A5J4YS23_PORPP|nr:Maf-like protein [Porphyridium purpureum]|eukprot:POR0777..scf229_5